MCDVAVGAIGSERYIQGLRMPTLDCGKNDLGCVTLPSSGVQCTRSALVVI